MSALESFCESWLVPNLPEFERAHPDIELSLEATLRYADFARDPGKSPSASAAVPGRDCTKPIVDLDYFPVCSPPLAAGEPGLRQPADLAHTR